MPDEEAEVRAQSSGQRSSETMVASANSRISRTAGSVSLADLRPPTADVFPPPADLRPLTSDLCPLTHLRSRSGRSGFTLVEVLLTALLMGIGLTVLLTGLSTCLRVMRLAREYDRVDWTLSVGECAYWRPELDGTKDVTKDWSVDADSSLTEGFTFERTVDKKTPEEEEKDKLYVVRTRVTWGEGASDEKQTEELVQYVWQRN